MSFSTSKKFFRVRMFAHKETQKTWSSKGDAMPSKVIDYSLDVKSIRNPIETLLTKVDGGWFKYFLEAKHLMRRKGGFISELKSTFAVSPFNMGEI